VCVRVPEQPLGKKDLEDIKTGLSARPACVGGHACSQAVVGVRAT